MDSIRASLRAPPSEIIESQGAIRTVRGGHLSDPQWMLRGRGFGWRLEKGTALPNSKAAEPGIWVGCGLILCRRLWLRHVCFRRQ